MGDVITILPNSVQLNSTQLNPTQPNSTTGPFSSVLNLQKRYLYQIGVEFYPKVIGTTIFSLLSPTQKKEIGMSNFVIPIIRSGLTYHVSLLVCKNWISPTYPNYP